MPSKELEEKINNIKSVSANIQYLYDEFDGKLWATKDGSVDIITMLEFAMDEDLLLQQIIEIARKIKAI